MKNILLRFFPLLAIALLLTACPRAVDDIAEIGEPFARPNVAVLVTEGFHDGEAYMPIGYLTNQGMDITVIGPEIGTVTAYNSDFSIVIERAVRDVAVDDFDALVLPGGRAPSALREIPEVVEFAEEFFNSGKPVGAICHGPQLLLTAGVLEGRTCTAVGGIRDELEEAGAIYKDEEVVIDGNLITSRTPPDLAIFSQTIGEAVHETYEPPVPRAVPPQPGM